MVAQPQQELCANCGFFVDRINEASGWCNECTLSLCPDALTCSNCGKPTTKGLCSTCRLHRWIEENQDTIDKYLDEGHTVKQAQRLARDELRPRCACCGNPIKHGRAGETQLCRANARCRRAKRRYRTLYTSADKISKSDAMKQVLEDIKNGRL